jgi:Uri superfamily endonuclease
VTNLKGTYALVLVLQKDTAISVGRLGTCSFPAGYYIYLGSALGGLFPRVRRHIRGGGRNHWHIDYLRRHAVVVEVWYKVSDERLECSWQVATMEMPSAGMPVDGFGSSGCTCRSHLVHFTFMPSLETFGRMLGAGGSDIQRMLPGQVA